MLYYIRVIWRSIIVTLKKRHWRSFKLVLFESLGVVSYSPSIVTGSILHYFQDKARYWSKIVIFIPPMHSRAPLGGGVSVGVLPSCLVRQNQNGGATRRWKRWEYREKERPGPLTSAILPSYAPINHQLVWLDVTYDVIGNPHYPYVIVDLGLQLALQLED